MRFHSTKGIYRGESRAYRCLIINEMAFEALYLSKICVIEPVYALA